MSLEEKKSPMIGYIAAIIAAALFGAISTIAKPALSSVNPILLSSLVYLIAAAFLTSLTRKSRIQEIKKKDFGLIFLVAICGGVLGPIIYFTGLEITTASDTAVISEAEILFTVLLAILFFKEKLQRSGYLALGLIVVGIFIITTNLDTKAELIDLNLGNLLVLFSTIFWALDNNISRIVTERIQSVARIAQIKTAIGGSISFAIAILLGVPILIESSFVPNLLLLGAGGFGASLLCFLIGLKNIGTVKTLLIFSLFSPFGLLTAAVFLGETISAYQIIAVVMMVLGVYLITKRSNPIKKEEPI